MQFLFIIAWHFSENRYANGIQCFCATLSIERKLRQANQKANQIE